MKSSPLGKNTSVKVLGLTPNGLCLLTQVEEYFLSYKEFP